MIGILCYNCRIVSDSEVVKKGKLAKAASRQLAVTSTKVKNYALERMAEALDKNAKIILDANSLDLEAGEKKELSRALLDRLSLDGKRISGMIEGIQVIKSLPDPVGEIISEWQRPNGLKIKKVRVPLGVIGIIYEARPNVTVDSAALCLKAGNAVILRGGSDVIQTNIEITKVIQDAAYNAGLRFLRAVSRAGNLDPAHRRHAARDRRGTDESARLCRRPHSARRPQFDPGGR